MRGDANGNVPLGGRASPPESARGDARPPEASPQLCLSTVAYSRTTSGKLRRVTNPSAVRAVSMMR